uniref:Uncharacterized protein n=1 Tax=Trichogramma kaykai TaxID=54128 RepID=A0ABD2WBQ8_9HYME
MSLKFALKNKLPISEISNLLKLINTLFSDQVICESKYFIDKILSSSSSGVEFYGICPICKVNIGKIEHFESNITCRICSEKIESNNPSCENLFMLIDPSDQIKSSIEENADYYLNIMHNRTRDKIIRHIYDGKAYRKFVKSLDDKYNYITATLNTDGAPRFESSTYSIWPIYLKLNEIPLDCTGKNVITIGLWFGKSKPDMNAFLEPVVNNLNSLSENGIECSIKNKTHCIKLYIIVVCVDAVARALMQGFMQYNAEYGCGWCLQAGEYYARSMRYRYLTPPAELRTHEGTIAHAATLVENNMRKNVYGVKNFSTFLLLNKFDLIIGFVVDYLHCALSGVGKRITECILSDLSGDQLKKMNLLLLDIKVPHQLARLTRSLDDRAQWKAREWENFILYYSLPVFSLVLKEKLFNYWSLFVNALYILLQREITYEKLDEADAMLHEFVRLTRKEYGKKNMTYNIHQLLHLAPSVENWGPLFAHSTFPFEAANHDLLQAIHCANGVNLQISRYLNMQNVVCKLEKCLSERSSKAKVKIYCKKFSTSESIDTVRIDNIMYLGRSLIMSPNLCETFQMPKTSLLYSRAVKDGCLYTTSTNRNMRSNNSYALLKNGQFIEIFQFAVDEVIKGIVIYKNVVVTGKLSEHIYNVSNIDNSLLKADTSDIMMICVFISSTHLGNRKFIAALPNLCDY